MALGAKLTALVTAVTAGADADAKTLALVPGLFDALVHEMCKSGPITTQQQTRVASLRAEAVDNIADFVTALEVA
jgi:hypothetical protein